jgi:hypothetical protein
MHLFLKLFILVKVLLASDGLSIISSSTFISNFTHPCNFYLAHAGCRMCSFELLMMDGKTETSRTFYKNKQFEKQVHLVGCTLRIYQSMFISKMRNDSSRCMHSENATLLLYIYSYGKPSFELREVFNNTSLT